MDKQKEEESVFYEVRGLKSCIVEGLKLPIRNIVPLMRMLWLPMLLTAVCMAVAVRAVPPLAGWLSGFSFLAPCSYAELWMLARTLVVLSVIWLFGSLYLGQLATAVSLYAGAGYIPSLTFGASRKYLTKNYLQALEWNAVWMVAGLLLAFLSARFLGMRWTLYAVMPLAFLLLFVPHCLVGIKLLVDDEARLSLGRAVKYGYQYWGRVFAVVGVCGLLALVFVLAGCLPSAVLSAAEVSFHRSLMEGDAVSNPSMFPYAQLFFAFLASVVSSLALWCVFFPLSYLFASLCRRAGMRQDAFGEEERGEWDKNQDSF